MKRPTIFRLAVLKMLLAFTVIPAFGAFATPANHGGSSSIISLQTPFSQVSVEKFSPPVGIECNPGTGGSGSGCGGG